MAERQRAEGLKKTERCRWTCSTGGALNRAGLTDESTQLLTLAAADGYAPCILHATSDNCENCVKRKYGDFC